MSRLTCGHNSQFPSETGPAGSRARAIRENPNGYALVALMIFVTVLLISLTEALPRVYQEGQRRREEEAIFRGEQYARAIYLFHRTLGRYPASVKELLKTNDVRYLREAYSDPLSPSGRWHFIHAAANGIIIDSTNQTSPVPGQPGGPQAPGSPGQPGQPGTGGSVFGSSSQMNDSQTSGSQTNGSSSMFGPASPLGGQSSVLEQSIASGGKRKPPKLSADCQSGQDTTFSTPKAQTGELLGAYIVGVSPCNLHASIRVLDKKNRYYKWEFLGINYLPYSMPKVQAIQPSSSFPNSPPGQPMGTSPGSAFPGTQGSTPQPSQNQNSDGIN